MTDPLPLEIPVADVQKLRQDNAEFVLLDVRGEDEHQTASIDGSRLLPMQEIAERIGELQNDRNKHIVVHCHHGGRSLRVTHMLRDAGFAKVQNMTGGIQAWSEQIDSNVPTY